MEAKMCAYVGKKGKKDHARIGVGGVLISLTLP